MMIHRLLPAGLWSLGCCAAFAATAATPELPGPGEYHIDSDSVTATTSGPYTARVQQHIDGASGQVTVTRRLSKPGVPPSTQVFKGEGPNRWCISAGKPDLSTLPGACHAPLRPEAGGVSWTVDCNGLRNDEHWRKLDGSTWERSFSVSAAPGAASKAPSPRELYAMMAPGMTPEQRAKAEVELRSMPTQADTERAMAPVIEKLERAARSGDPQEAAAAKQQLAAIRAQLGNGGAAPLPYEVKVTERWKRVSLQCAERR